jgi:hypothetical protein
MHAAARVLRDAGREVDAGRSADAHLRRAVYWHHYSNGPVSDLHRSCGRDVARGSLRLWAAAGGVPEVPSGRRPGSSSEAPDPVRRRASAQLARVQLSGQARTVCGALRDDLAAQAAGMGRSEICAFGQRVRHEVLRVIADFDETVSGRLAELGLPIEAAGWSDLPGEERLPARRRPGLENRLSTLIGAGFGVGVSLSIGRMVADLRPEWTPAAAICGGLLGLALTSWIVLARRLLAERAAAERWILEIAASLRLVLEERLLSRILAAECAGV